MDDLFNRYRQHRNPEDFRLLVDRHIDAVYSHCVSRLHDPNLAQDVTQAVFVMLSRKAPDLPRETVLGGWLFTASRFACSNACRERARRRKYEKEAAEMRSEIQSIGPEQAVRQLELQASVNKALDQLGGPDRDAVVLRFFEHLTPAQLADRLGISEVAGRQRVSRALRRLRQIIRKSDLALPTTALASTLRNATSLKAPTPVVNLALTTANPTTAGTATTIADGALRMMALAKLKLAAAIAAIFLSVLAAGGFTVLALQNGATTATQSPQQPHLSPTTVPRTPTAAPAIAEDEQAPAQVTIETLNTLQRLAQAMRDNNLEEIRKSTYTDETPQGRMTSLLVTTMVPAEHRMLNAATKAFGTTKPAEAAMFDEWLESAARSMLAHIGPADLATVADDRASLILLFDVNDIPRYRVGCWVDEWRNTVLHFRKIDGTWKLDLPASMRVHFVRGKRKMTEAEVDRDPDPYIKFWTRSGTMLAEVAQQIEQGTLKSPAAAQQAMQKLAKEQVADPAGIQRDSIDPAEKSQNKAPPRR